ncbi:dihydrodipicolinate synthase family protein [Bacillus testis]|uniref:dihydrodipicolinate synthase family protein n=1 Tax=Bacillus testis TaxID=1622072 RepID=UPI00067F1CA3|nr:dihydrodipicolinate synthase family protein [Bacillus testis]
MMDPLERKLLLEGTVIPAHPLALTEQRMLDEQSQRALTRYYMDAGAGGIAVGVHTTQFEIRDPEFKLFEKVLTLAMEEVEKARLKRPFIKVAGICGPTDQAVKEAEFAKSIGYSMGLLNMGNLDHYSEEELLARAKAVADLIPVFGFYLQPSVGGRVLSYRFWSEFSNIQNVHAIKIAPFDRYKTLDVVRAVCQSPRRDDIALYTGNDDSIIHDLLSIYKVHIDGKWVEKRIAGGLLGHWAVWTKRAVDLFEELKKARMEPSIPGQWLMKANEVTDANSVLFDAKNHFKGCIAGINEVLARQGLLQGNWCLKPEEQLSPGQNEEIDRIYQEYPHMNDDEFIKENIERWRKHSS